MSKLLLFRNASQGYSEKQYSANILLQDDLKMIKTLLNNKNPRFTVSFNQSGEYRIRTDHLFTASEAL